MGKMKYLLLLLLAGACFAQSEFNAYYTKLNSGESWESDYKQGVIVDTDGTETLIIWLNNKIDSQLEIKISS